MQNALVLLGLTATAVITAPVSVAEPPSCDGPSCTPGIVGDVALGAPCDDTSYYVFGTTSWGRLVFCGSPRRYAPRYFRAPTMDGIKVEGATCEGKEFHVAQGPDGLFLICVATNGVTSWQRGDT
ncbi:hypothetical protein [Mycobacterium aquaticum]|uniref:Secreted protein n=1 Tax=Mycobacterium aquaticum TaxID=1927124 RepID=A0A1X0AX61_9MYCO|nr:hypothetical protein [Mycobacterium aquaticum]ORA34495.1 hypothetical protein BST13_17325 [Mycobacterium aquaticum]